MKNKQLPRKTTVDFIAAGRGTTRLDHISKHIFLQMSLGTLAIIKHVYVLSTHPYRRLLNNKVFLVRRLERRNVTENLGTRTAPYLTSRWCQTTRRQASHSSQDVFSLKCGSTRTISQVIH